MAWRLEGLTRPRPDQATAEAGLLLLVAAGAWAGTVLLARGMAGMTGTMGLSLAVGPGRRAGGRRGRAGYGGGRHLAAVAGSGPARRAPDDDGQSLTCRESVLGGRSVLPVSWRVWP